MFDFGISELAVIAVVALVVIGPERLPKVARTVGTLLGRAQRYVNDVKAEVNREMELDELRKLKTEMQEAAQGIQQQVTTAGAEMQSAVQDMEKQLNDGIVPATAPAATAELSNAPPWDPGLMTPLAEPPADNAAPAATAPESVAAPAEPTAPAASAPAEPPQDKPAQASLFPEHTIR